MTIYANLREKAASGIKQAAVLIDPDKYDLASLDKVIRISQESGIDYFFMGGSLLLHDGQEKMISMIREQCTIPVILFPGNSMQLCDKADGILLLSLISGRNPDLLIGRHVVSAPYLKASGLEILSTGYMLIESGRTTSVTYMSNTMPIPEHKEDIAVCTAMAGEMLGMKAIYLDAGSGALRPVPHTMIRRVKEAIGLPLIIGGGITRPELASGAFQAGADLVVVGNAIEKDPGLIRGIAEARSAV